MQSKALLSNNHGVEDMWNDPLELPKAVNKLPGVYTTSENAQKRR